MSAREQALVGCLLGTAVGDALGLAYEGLSARRAARVFGPPDHYRFLCGRGLVSDDTEHTLLVAQALLESHGDPDEFERRLAWLLRWWLLSFPAGVGWATLRAIARLWLGFPPRRSGVFSAGNGPAMRSAVLGVAYGNSFERLPMLVGRSARMTHTDPKAYAGALVVALAAHLSAEGQAGGAALLSALDLCLPDDRSTGIKTLIQQAVESAERNEPLERFASAIGTPGAISGYILHTVPCVIQVWLRHADNFEAGVCEIVGAGGDADTTGAILGGILGARVGKAGIPARWLATLAEWPRNVRWMEKLAGALAARLDGSSEAVTPAYFRPAIPLRNCVFLVVVLLHGLRRMAPPY